MYRSSHGTAVQKLCTTMLLLQHSAVTRDVVLTKKVWERRLFKK